MAREPEAIAAIRRALGEKLAAFRQAAALTQADISKVTFCDRTTVAHIERGRSRADERFWQIADERCQAGGALLVAFHELESTKQIYESQARAAELAKARAKADSLRGVSLATNAPWTATDILRRLHRTDIGAEALEQVESTIEDMCCEYAWRNADELIADANQQLTYIARLMDGPRTLTEHRGLLVQAGWLMLLVGCVQYDIGQYRRADQSRAAALRIGQETGHGGIIAWSFEMLAWFALTQGDLTAVASYAEAGMKAAPHTSVVVQLAAQAAKAAARMGQRDEVGRILDRGYRMLGQHERPLRPENHFVVDPQKWDFYAMDCYRLAHEDRRAADHAYEVLRLSRRPDGADKSPMRATEARLTLAVVAARQGDLDLAANWTNAALGARRKSVDQLVMIADELKGEVRRLFSNDPATEAVTGPIDQACAELRTQ